VRHQLQKGLIFFFYKRSKGQLKWGGMEKAMTKYKLDPKGAIAQDVDGFIEVKSKKKKTKKPVASLNGSVSGRRGKR